MEKLRRYKERVKGKRKCKGKRVKGEKIAGLPLRQASRATSGIVLSGTCYVLSCTPWARTASLCIEEDRAGVLWVKQGMVNWVLGADFEPSLCWGNLARESVPTRRDYRLTHDS